MKLFWGGGLVFGYGHAPVGPHLVFHVGATFCSLGRCPRLAAFSAAASASAAVASAAASSPAGREGH